MGMSRAEQYLEYALKNQETYPKPISRLDYYLLSVAQEVRSGVADPATITDAVNNYLAENPPATMTDEQIAASVNRSIFDGSINVDSGSTDYDDTQIKNDMANKQDIIDNGLDTTDKAVVGAINEVNSNLLDTVGFSADYKNIILNRKNGLNPYIIPINAIINNAKLIELNDVDSTDIGDGKLCATSVEDVSLTSVTCTLPDTITFPENYITTAYIVKNGVASIHFTWYIASATKSIAWTTVATNIPIPAIEQRTFIFPETNITNGNIGIAISTTGELKIYIPTDISVKDWWKGTITYPVA